MNKHLLLLFIGLFITKHTLNAQTPFNTIDSLDINNLHAAAMVHGDVWGHTVPRTYNRGCDIIYPYRKTVGGANAIWLSAYDNSGLLHLSAQTFRYNESVDFWPGPLRIGRSASYSTSYAWAKIWKINKKDL